MQMGKKMFLALVSILFFLSIIAFLNYYVIFPITRLDSREAV